jgi:hypothetical protein
MPAPGNGRPESGSGGGAFRAVEMAGAFAPRRLESHDRAQFNRRLPQRNESRAAVVIATDEQQTDGGVEHEGYFAGEERSSRVQADESGKGNAGISGAEEKQKILEGGVHVSAFVVLPPIASPVPSASIILNTQYINGMDDKPKIMIQFS